MTRIEIIRTRKCRAGLRAGSARGHKRALQRRMRVVYASLPLWPFAAAVTGRGRFSGPPVIHSISKKRSRITDIVAKMKGFFK